MYIKQIILLLLIVSGLETQGQVFIQGKSVLPFNDVAKSKYLSAESRLNMTDAYSLLQSNDNKSFIKNKTDLVGEFWKHEGMLIQIVSRKASFVNSLDLDFEQLRWSISNGASSDHYFDEIKTVNNFKTLIHYHKISVVKYFLIKDNLERYYLRGSIICAKKDIPKAEAFMDTLLKSITFK